MSTEELQEPDLLSQPSKAEAADFVRALVHWVGPGFHPDTDFNDYVKWDTHARAYPASQAGRLNAKLDRAANVLRRTDADVYDIAAPVQHAILTAYFDEASSSR